MSPTRMPRAPSRKRRTSSFRPRSCRRTTGCSTGPSRSSASATTTTWSHECEAAVQQQFGSQVSAARSQPHYLDVTHPTANKGVVIERLSDHFKIPLEQIATLGDQPNDVLMFRRSGLSIAMGNASEEVQPPGHPRDRLGRGRGLRQGDRGVRPAAGSRRPRVGAGHVVERSATQDRADERSACDHESHARPQPRRQDRVAGAESHDARASWRTREASFVLDARDTGCHRHDVEMVDGKAMSGKTAVFSLGCRWGATCLQTNRGDTRRGLRELHRRTTTRRRVMQVDDDPVSVAGVGAPHRSTTRRTP